MTASMWRRFIERGGWWVLAQSGLMALVVVLGPVSAGEDRCGGARATAGLALGMGAVFGLAGVAVLKGHRTIFPRPNPEGHLVQHGIYRWVRHPLYASLMLLAAGWSLWWWSWPTALAGLVLACFLNLKAAREEIWLKAKFPEYEGYSGRVNRFWPKLF